MLHNERFLGWRPQLQQQLVTHVFLGFKGNQEKTHHTIDTTLQQCLGMDYGGIPGS